MITPKSNYKKTQHRHGAKPSQASQPAFTLIEVTIVVVIMAVLTVALALSFTGARTRATFTDQQLQVVNIIQKARGLSLSNSLDSRDNVIDYYRLYVDSLAPTITLSSITTTDAGLEVEQEVDSVELEEGFQIIILDEDGDPSGDWDFAACYIPPYGEIQFGFGCSDRDTEMSFALSNSTIDREVTITISVHGGYPEVTE
jgi:prepilin-type N-terminal cleavage/methylation domain-containing protein